MEEREGIMEQREEGRWKEGGRSMTVSRTVEMRTTLCFKREREKEKENRKARHSSARWLF